jgi:hypothetical protein
VYRFFPTGVPYQSELTVVTEHGVGNRVPALYSSVVFYYERSDPATQVDVLDVGEQQDEAAHRYTATPASDIRALTSRFEARHGESEVTDRGRDVIGRSRFTMTAPAGHGALRLRRLRDQARSQVAEVWVNGQFAGRWSSPASNPDRRWADDDFLLPSSLTQGRTSLDIEIRAIDGSWSEFRYELWATPL